MLVAACGIPVALLKYNLFRFAQKTRSRPDGSMWCLIYLERQSPNALVSLLKANTFDVHIAPDIDDLLDALWFHGSKVGCIVMETHASKGLQEFFQALKDWPDLKVLVFHPLVHSVGKEAGKIHFEPTYAHQSVSRWLGGSHPGSIEGASPF